MKYVIIIIDGAADEPLKELNGQTPLERANIQAMDWIAAHGEIGSVNNIPRGFACGSDVAIMSLLGYNPEEFYSGRAPIEAIAQDLKISPGCWVFRCNLVTIQDNIMKDHSAGEIPNHKANRIIKLLNKNCLTKNIQFYSGVSYRNLVTINQVVSVTTTPPHDIVEQNITPYLPKGKHAPLLIDLIKYSQKLLKNDSRNHSATSIWLWGQGKKPSLPLFYKRFALKGAVITAVDLVRGLAKLIGWDIIEVSGATGNAATNYKGKGLASVDALKHYDLVCVHIEATDEAGHKGDFIEKIACLEKIDKYVVAPLLKALQEKENQWRILLLPDHPTPCTVRTHTPAAVPFAIASNQILKSQNRPFNEKSALTGRFIISKGHLLMHHFLKI